MDEETSEWRRIDFPRRIGQKEARTLCRHLTFTLEGNCYISLNTSRSECFWDRFQDKTPTTLEEVPLIPGEMKLSGAVQRTSNVSSVEFVFDKIYDRRGRIGYEGICLSVGVYDWKDLNGNNKELVLDVRSAIQGYFEWKKR